MFLISFCWGNSPVTVGNYANLGYDTFTGLQASAVFSQAGAAFGVFLKTKDKELKGVSASAALTGLFGITEPAIYGVNLRLKKPMICGCIAGAVGGAVGGAFRAVSWGYNMPGIATLPAYFKAGHATQFIGLLLSILVAFVLGTVLTIIVGFEDNASDNTANDSENSEADIEADNENAAAKITNAVPSALSAPVTGNVIPVNQVKDEAFASEAMGKGVGIQPENGKVYAPFDGSIDAVFPTGHLVGMSDVNGTQILIHIGIDTVKLEGRGFELKVAQGDKVKKGDLLVEFDKNLLEKEGYDSTVMFIVSDPTKNVNVHEGRKEAVKDCAFEII